MYYSIYYKLIDVCVINVGYIVIMHEKKTQKAIYFIGKYVVHIISVMDVIIDRIQIEQMKRVPVAIFPTISEQTPTWKLMILV